MSRPSLRQSLRVVRQQVGMLGVGLSLRYLLLYLLDYRPGRDDSFDRRHGTDTTGLFRPDDWESADELTRAQGVGYVPSPPQVTRYMLRSLPVDPAEFTFVDVGCGKGRVVLVASEFPFRRVVGVELSPQLCGVAERNIERFRSRRRRRSALEVQCAEATTWPLPAGDLVLHFYHPFGADVLRRFLAHVSASVDASPRRILLLYLRVSREVREVFAEFPAFPPLAQVQCWNPNYSWSLYASLPARNETATPS